MRRCVMTCDEDFVLAGWVVRAGCIVTTVAGVRILRVSSTTLIGGVSRLTNARPVAGFATLKILAGTPFHRVTVVASSVVMRFCFAPSAAAAHFVTGWLTSPEQETTRRIAPDSDRVHHQAASPRVSVVFMVPCGVRQMAPRSIFGGSFVLLTGLPDRGRTSQCGG